MKKSSVFERHKRFKQGRENVEDERNGHPGSHRSDKNVEKVLTLAQRLNSSQ
jgi:hypothetical protein